MKPLPRARSILGRALVVAATGATVAAALPGCARPGQPAAASALLPVGAPVPDLDGVDQHGQPHHLRALAGKPVVVYFYPKDATPGCTREACAFRDVWDRYTAAGIAVFGVSGDQTASHAHFAADHGLKFPLIADPDGTWARAFGVPIRLGLYARVTFLVGRDGKIARTYANVDPGVHATEVLAAAQSLP